MKVHAQSRGSLTMSDESQPIARDLQWVRQFKRGDKIVWIDVDELDRSWRTDSSLYVGNGGRSPDITSAAKYEKFGRWIVDHDEIRMPHIALDEHGNVSFTDGRHRFAWLRDYGVQSLPVTVSPDIEAEVQRRFGTESRMSRLTSSSACGG
jgi:hypothetical protein